MENTGEHEDHGVALPLKILATTLHTVLSGTRNGDQWSPFTR
jgi:hypothetical protein